MTWQEEVRQIAKSIWPHLKDKVREFVNSFVSTATEERLATKLGADDTAVRAAGLLFGTVDAGSSATNMTATVPGVTELYEGLCVYICNPVVASKATWTLNVNGLGALPVYPNHSTTRSSTIFALNYNMVFIYREEHPGVTGGSGPCWDILYGYDSNTNTIGYQLRTNAMTLPMSDVVYRYRLLFTSADGTKFVPANTSTSTNATATRPVCQTKINPHGPIVYYGTTAKVDAGSRPSAASLWRQYVITLGYSFNKTGAALALTEWTPVYIKCAPQSDGSAVIDDNTPYVQALPSTEDGKIYIYLGVAVSATTVEMDVHHPIYQYKSGKLQLWTGA